MTHDIRQKVSKKFWKGITRPWDQARLMQQGSIQYYIVGYFRLQVEFVTNSDEHIRIKNRKVLRYREESFPHRYLEQNSCHSSIKRPHISTAIHNQQLWCANLGRMASNQKYIENQGESPLILLVPQNKNQKREDEEGKPRIQWPQKRRNNSQLDPVNREWRFTANLTKLVPQEGKKQTQFK